jgi:peptide/nickel transport system permease protein
MRARRILKLVARRSFVALWIVFAAITTVFFAANGIGDPAVATLGPRARPAQIEAFRQRYGLDRPLLEQYGSYLGGALQGDLGRSFRDDEPVTRVILTRLPRTVLLGAMALLFELIFGLVLGTLAALRRQTAFDTGFMALAFLGISAPSYLTGLLFLDVFAFRFGWFPIGGYGDGFLGHVAHALLPAFTLAIIGAATYARIMRSEMIETMQADYIRTARAKGLAPLQVIVGHGVRTALLPIATLVGLSLPLLVSGAIITEQIFSWPGMGRLAVESISSLDVPMIMGVVIIAAITVQVGNLLADVSIALLDPRVE